MPAPSLLRPLLLAVLLPALTGCLSPKSQAYTLRGRAALPTGYEPEQTRAELTYLAPRRFLWLEASPSPFDGSLARFVDRSSDPVSRTLPIDGDGVVRIDRSLRVLWADTPVITITAADRPTLLLRFRVDPDALGEPARFEGFVLDLGRPPAEGDQPLWASAGLSIHLDTAADRASRR